MAYGRPYLFYDVRLCFCLVPVALFCTGCCIVQCLVSLRYLQYIATSPGSSSNSIHELGLGFPSRTLSSPAIGCPLPLHKPMQVSGCDTGGVGWGKRGTSSHGVGCPCRSVIVLLGSGWERKGMSSPATGCMLPLHIPMQVSGCDTGGGGGGGGCPQPLLVACYPSTNPCRSVVLIQVGRGVGWGRRGMSSHGVGCPCPLHKPMQVRSCDTGGGGGGGDKRDVLIWSWLPVQVWL